MSQILIGWLIKRGLNQTGPSIFTKRTLLVSSPIVCLDYTIPYYMVCLLLHLYIYSHYNSIYGIGFATPDHRRASLTICDSSPLLSVFFCQAAMDTGCAGEIWLHRNSLVLIQKPREFLIAIHQIWLREYQKLLSDTLRFHQTWLAGKYTLYR